MNPARSSAVNSVFCLAQRLVDDADDHAVEDPRGAADDVEVAVGDRVVAARADRRSRRRAHRRPGVRGCGSSSRRRRARPAAAALGSSIGSSAAVSTITRASSPIRRTSSAVEVGAKAGRDSIGRVAEARGRRSDPSRSQEASASPRTSSARSPSPRSRDVALGRADRPCRRTSRARRRARAPRSRARRCRRRGRGRSSPSTSPRIEKSASRTRSLVGRTSSSARRPQAAPAELSGDRPSCGDRLGALVAEASADRVDQRAERRRLERAVLAEQLEQVRAGRDEQAGVLGQARDPEAAAARSGGCRAPRPPRAARGRPRRARKPSRSRTIASSRRRARSDSGSAKRMQCDSCSPRPIRPRSWWSWLSP